MPTTRNPKSELDVKSLEGYGLLLSRHDLVSLLMSEVLEVPIRLGRFGDRQRRRWITLNYDTGAALTTFP